MKNDASKEKTSLTRDPLEEVDEWHLLTPEKSSSFVSQPPEFSPGTRLLNTPPFSIRLSFI